jgi:hypothetical protein
MSWPQTTIDLFQKGLKTAVETAMQQVDNSLNPYTVGLYPQLLTGALIRTVQEHLSIAVLDEAGPVLSWVPPEKCEEFKHP